MNETPDLPDDGVLSLAEAKRFARIISRISDGELERIFASGIINHAGLIVRGADPVQSNIIVRELWLRNIFPNIEVSFQKREVVRHRQSR